MKVVNNDRAVAVLGPVSPEVAAVLRSLDLAPFNDDSGDATLWLPAQRAIRPSAAPVIGATSPSKEREPLLLTIVQAAAALSVGRSTVYEMIARGDLDVVHLGRAVRVAVCALEELLEDLRGQSAAPSEPVGGCRLAAAWGLSS
jgi:excisionase family DNA binding protein